MWKRRNKEIIWSNCHLLTNLPLSWNSAVQLSGLAQELELQGAP